MNTFIRSCLAITVFQASSLLCLNTGWAQPYDRAPNSLRIMTWNVEWMFDDYLGNNRSQLAREQSAPSQEFWEAKLAGVAEVIAAAKPDIVALQEIEGGETLSDIARQLKMQHQLSYGTAFIEGSDSFTEQDVGFLFRSGLASFRRHEQSKAMFGSREYYNLSKHLVAEFRWADIESPLTIMTVHLRATPEAEELRTKQALLARHWLEPQLQLGQDVVLLGDFNSEHPVLKRSSTESLRGEVAAIIGGEGAVSMVDLLSHLPDIQQSTHLVLDKQFDRLFVSPGLMEDGPESDWCFEKVEVLAEAVLRGKRDGQEHWHKRLTMPIAELDLSDHLPVMATFSKR